MFVLNSPFMQARAAALARRLQLDAGEDAPARIRRAHWLLFGREASAAGWEKAVLGELLVLLLLIKFL